MTDVTSLVPGPTDWMVRWDDIDAAFPEVAAMRGTPHDPVFHAEGCPWTHTRMVCEAMAASEAYRRLGERDREAAFLTAVLHDIAKPATASHEDGGRIRHPGHSRVGAVMARVTLWRHGVDPALRERVCSAIGSHQVPFWLFERDWAQTRRFIIGASVTCGNGVLSIQADADARGRVAPDVGRMVENVELYRLAAEELGCLEAPYPVRDGATLRSFMASPGTVDPDHGMPGPIHRPVATVMSGLPGSGKTTWLRANHPDLPVVSLDAIREELGIDPAKPQGQVVAFAKSAAKEFLRAGRDFAWDGTNLSRDLRDGILGMCRDYGFATRLVVTEASPAKILSAFRARGRAVPKEVFDRLLRRWDHPAPWEADEVIGKGFTQKFPPPAGTNPSAGI